MITLKIKNIALAAVLVFVLGACGTAPPKIEVREVLIPVAAQCPAPPAEAFERPWLPIHDLTDVSTNDEVVKAYALSVKELQTWGLTLEEYLRGYIPDETVTNPE